MVLTTVSDGSIVRNQNELLSYFGVYSRFKLAARDRWHEEQIESLAVYLIGLRCTAASFSCKSNLLFLNHLKSGLLTVIAQIKVISTH